MKSNGQNVAFYGQYEVELDKGGRFVFPEQYRSKLEASSQGQMRFFFFPRDVLYIYSAIELFTLVDIAMGWQDQSIARKIWYLACKGESPLSQDGVVQIPAWLVEKYGLSGQEKITLIGMKNHIEVWDSASFNKMVEEFDRAVEPQFDQMYDDLLSGRFSGH